MARYDWYFYNHAESDRYHISQFLSAKFPWTYHLPYIGHTLLYRYLKTNVIANLINLDRIEFLRKSFFNYNLIHWIISIIVIIILLIANSINKNLIPSIPRNLFFVNFFVIFSPWFFSWLISFYMWKSWKDAILLLYQIETLEITKEVAERAYWRVKVFNFDIWIKTICKNKRKTINEWFFNDLQRPLRKETVIYIDEDGLFYEDNVDKSYRLKDYTQYLVDTDPFGGIERFYITKWLINFFAQIVSYFHDKGNY